MVCLPSLFFLPTAAGVGTLLTPSTAGKDATRHTHWRDHRATPAPPPGHLPHLALLVQYIRAVGGGQGGRGERRPHRAPAASHPCIIRRRPKGSTIPRQAPTRVSLWATSSTAAAAAAPVAPGIGSGRAAPRIRRRLSPRLWAGGRPRARCGSGRAAPCHPGVLCWGGHSRAPLAGRRRRHRPAGGGGWRHLRSGARGAAPANAFGLHLRFALLCFVFLLASLVFFLFLPPLLRGAERPTPPPAAGCGARRAPAVSPTRPAPPARQAVSGGWSAMHGTRGEGFVLWVPTAGERGTPLPGREHTTNRTHFPHFRRDQRGRFTPGSSCPPPRRPPRRLPPPREHPR